MLPKFKPPSRAPLPRPSSKVLASSPLQPNVNPHAPPRANRAMTKPPKARIAWDSRTHLELALHRLRRFPAPTILRANSGQIARDVGRGRRGGQAVEDGLRLTCRKLGVIVDAKLPHVSEPRESRHTGERSVAPNEKLTECIDRGRADHELQRGIGRDPEVTRARE